MKFKLFCCAILLCGIIVIRLLYVDYRVIRFNDYLKKFNKSYGEGEFKKRMLYFEESLEEIKRLNYGEHRTGAVHGLTKFSDWHKDEFNNGMLLKGTRCENYVNNECYDGFRGSIMKKNESSKKMPIIPDRLDWRNVDGVIGPVQNQKQCNGCWAFGIVGVMEAMAAIVKIGYDRLSVQQLIDCSTMNKHCDSGNIDTALKFLCFTHLNLTTEEKYPLRLVNEECRPQQGGKRGIKNFEIICHLDDYTIMKRLVHGPVMVVVKPNGWLNYVSGIITWNCFDDGLGLSHVVQIVGYDTAIDEQNNEVPFYIVKNSYGSDWGEQGYIRIARSKKRNLCGLYDHMAWLDVN